MHYEMLTPMTIGIVLVNILVLILYTRYVKMVHKRIYKKYTEEVSRQYKFLIEEIKRKAEVDACNRHNLELYPEECPHCGKKIKQ